MFIPSPAQILNFLKKRFTCKPVKNGRWVKINSPFSEDKGYNFNICLSGHICHDWRSDDWAGKRSQKTGHRDRSFVWFVRKLLSCSYEAAVEAITEGSGHALPSLKPSGPAEPPEPQETYGIALPPLSEPLWDSSQPMLAGIITSWLATRGVTKDDVRTYKIYHASSEVVFPYFEYGDEPIYWQTRSRLNKRFNFPSATCGVSKGQFLYNFNNIQPAQELCIAESIFVCLTLREQAVASGGAALTPEQIRKIRLLGPRRGIILAPDNDKAGMDSVISNARLLEPLGHPIYYSLPPHLEYIKDGKREFTKDWNELFEHLHMAHGAIHAVFEKNIKKFNTLELVKLAGLIAKCN